MFSIGLFLCVCFLWEKIDLISFIVDCFKFGQPFYLGKFWIRAAIQTTGRKGNPLNSKK